MSKVSEEILTKRKKAMSEFRAYREKREAEFEETKVRRSQLRDGRDDTKSEGVEEEVVEFFTKEEIILIDEED